MKRKNLLLYLSIGLFFLSIVSLVGIIAYAQPGDPPLNDTAIVKVDTIRADQPYPSFTFKELPSTTGGTIGTMLYALIGFTLWFIFEWRKKKKRDPATSFSFSIWIKDNWFNIAAFVIGLVILNWQAGAMHPVSAIMIGLVPNALIDWVMKEFETTT